MNRYYYDFHVHSCLSPCADNDMTPNNIAGMATLAGLNIVALTDHNTVRNCPAFFEAAKRYGIIPIAGMELTTAEDIHVVCLFEHLEDALEFGREVDARRIKIVNRTDIFGEQLVVDGQDNVLASEEHLLPNATTITLEESVAITEKYQGICFPAHIDRQANGVIATLGCFPESPEFKCAELYDINKKKDLCCLYPKLKSKLLLCSSDAHYLNDIRDKSVYFELEDQEYSSKLIRKKLFSILREGRI
ncbi:MAG: PHP domain-containing protein [bacterium]|nr:PHP domain-containing protein [bacterium]